MKLGILRVTALALMFFLSPLVLHAHESHEEANPPAQWFSTHQTEVLRTVLEFVAPIVFVFGLAKFTGAPDRQEI